MVKKKYVKPSMEVYSMPERPRLLDLSNGELGQIPTIPGQPDDEKHLA